MMRRRKERSYAECLCFDEKKKKGLQLGEGRLKPETLLKSRDATTVRLSLWVRGNCVVGCLKCKEQHGFSERCFFGKFSFGLHMSGGERSEVFFGIGYMNNSVEDLTCLHSFGIAGKPKPSQNVIFVRWYPLPPRWTNVNMDRSAKGASGVASLWQNFPKSSSVCFGLL